MKFDEPRSRMFELRTFLNPEKLVPDLRCPTRRELHRPVCSLLVEIREWRYFKDDAAGLK